MGGLGRTKESRSLGRLAQPQPAALGSWRSQFELQAIPVQERFALGGMDKTLTTVSRTEAQVGFVRFKFLRMSLILFPPLSEGSIVC